MAQIYISYNPYRLETRIDVNGNQILNDSSLYKIVKGKRLQEWVGKFPQMLVDELNTIDFDVEFHGMVLDWDDLEDAFLHAKEEGIIKNLNLKFIEGKSDEDINEKIVRVFQDLQEGPVDDFRDPELIKKFKDRDNSDFPIHVIATMSSGKSTLINALLRKKLMPSRSEACTAVITEILDNDKEIFEAVVYDHDNKVLSETSELTYDIMNEWNENDKVYRISAKGDIPFLDAKGTALKLIDTPGPNNAATQEHKNTTYRAINSNSNNLILYVLNASQLQTNDDNQLLSDIAEQIKKGGKQMRDKFLFVINKMDTLNLEEDDPKKAIRAVKAYLSSKGIEDPQIFPCSAFAALNIRTRFEGIDIDNLTRSEEKKLPQAVRDTLPMIDKFVEHDSMHLEQYSTLSPSAQRDLEYTLRQAEKNGDTKEQALIHSGIYSIETAITAYVKKYAKTKKIKDLVETFQAVMESTEILQKAKKQVSTNEKAAEACKKRAEAINAKIEDGKEAEEFKARIAQLNPMGSIQYKADTLKMEATNKTNRVFAPYGDMIDSRSEAKRLVEQFVMMSSDYIADLTSKLESVINQEVMETGEKILMEYQEKLAKFDEDAADQHLDFGTADLIRGALNNMKQDIQEWCSDDFAAETIEDYGEVSYEEKVYYEKVGQEAEEVYDGTEEVKVGTKRVKVGSHREKTGTRTIKNPKRKGFFGALKIWESKYIEEDVYETVDDYKNEDVYETVAKYKTVMRDVYEERREQIEKFSAETSVIQAGLVSKLRRNLDEGIEDALEYAKDQVESMKIQFTDIFDDLDKLIQQKYKELNECTKDQETKEAELEKSKKILAWIEACKAEIEEILTI